MRYTKLKVDLYVLCIRDINPISLRDLLRDCGMGVVSLRLGVLSGLSFQKDTYHIFLSDVNVPVLRSLVHQVCSAGSSWYARV